MSTRVALVTGAGRRIGASIAEYMHKYGWSVVIHCNNSESEASRLCESLNKERKNSAKVISADLTQKKSCEKLINDTVIWRGRLDLLVNNASLFISNRSLDTNIEILNKLFTINVQAPYWLSLTARKFLAEQQGSIINITDIHAESPLKGYSEYCQTKAALAMQTKSLAREFAPEIRVNAVAPGAILWPEQGNSLNSQQQQKIIDKTPLLRHGDPIFIAQAVLSLVDNEFITGQTLLVDGGRSL